MPAHDHVVDRQHVDGILQNREAVEVRVDDDVGDVAVDERTRPATDRRFRLRGPGCPSSLSTGIAATAATIAFRRIAGLPPESHEPGRDCSRRDVGSVRTPATCGGDLRAGASGRGFAARRLGARRGGGGRSFELDERRRKRPAAMLVELDRGVILVRGRHGPGAVLRLRYPITDGIKSHAGLLQRRKGRAAHALTLDILPHQRGSERRPPPPPPPPYPPLRPPPPERGVCGRASLTVRVRPPNCCSWN